MRLLGTSHIISAGYAQEFIIIQKELLVCRIVIFGREVPQILGFLAGQHTEESVRGCQISERAYIIIMQLHSKKELSY